jgi:hypothetical protein
MRVAACNAGLPFDVAFGAEDHFVIAWVIANGENDGGEFDFNAMRWLERNG